MKVYFVLTRLASMWILILITFFPTACGHYLCLGSALTCTVVVTSCLACKVFPPPPFPDFSVTNPPISDEFVIKGQSVVNRQHVISRYFSMKKTSVKKLFVTSGSNYTKRIYIRLFVNEFEVRVGYRLLACYCFLVY